MSWIEDYYAAWNAESPDGVAAFMADDVVFEDVTAGHVARGAHQVRKFVEICNEKVPGVSYELVHSHACPDSYAAEWVMQPMGLRGVSYGTLREGRITSNRDYWNGAALPAVSGTGSASVSPVRRLLELLQEGGPAEHGVELAALFDADAEYCFHVPTAETVRGRDAVLAELTRQTTHYSDLRCEVRSTTATGDRFVIEREDSFVLAGTSTRVSYPLAAVFDLTADGLIGSWREYWDREVLTAQAGSATA